MRQVQLAAGALVLLGVLLGWLVRNGAVAEEADMPVPSLKRPLSQSALRACQ